MGSKSCDMSRFAGSCRFVYNKALALQKARDEADKKIHSYTMLARQLPCAVK